jgi:para-nitrobenzyl esterase
MNGIRRTFPSILALAITAALTPIATSSASSYPLDGPVKVDGGLISGTPAGPDVSAFKGIPFAAPPVGNLRWKPPQPVKPWSGVKACTQYGPSCPQPNLLERIYGEKLGPTGEDCLYLNVWTPAKRPTDRLPVLVWIHGGGYTMGSGSSRAYNGEGLSRLGSVVVTINYRLGPFAWLAHPALSKESEHNSSGNYGLLDQIAALQWVKRNIAAFGGDPGRVTIFGESAGAGSVCYLMVSPLAKGLFHRAIAESGTAFGQNRHIRESWYGLEPAEKMGERIAREMGADKEKDPIAALRAKSAEELLAGSNMSASFFSGGGNRFAPIVDGWVVPDDPGAIFEAGKQHPVPLIAGSNADEGSIFALTVPVGDAMQYRNLVKTMFAEQADEVLAMYPASNAAEARSAISRIIGDAFFVSGARSLARMHSKVTPNVFVYHFTRVRPDPRRASLGAFHAAEIPYVFKGLDSFGAAAEPRDEELAKTISSSWIRFAAAGDPNVQGQPVWPRYDASDRHLEFGDEVMAKSGLRKAACDLFEKISAERRVRRKAAGS